MSAIGHRVPPNNRPIFGKYDKKIVRSYVGNREKQSHAQYRLTYDTSIAPISDIVYQIGTQSRGEKFRRGAAENISDILILFKLNG